MILKALTTINVDKKNNKIKSTHLLQIVQDRKD